MVICLWRPSSLGQTPASVSVDVARGILAWIAGWSFLKQFDEFVDRWSSSGSLSLADRSNLAISLPGVITRRADAHAQALQGYHHPAWTTENGLSAVFAVQQAPNGFLWLTTSTGIFRFDGLRFESTDEVTNQQVHNADIVTVFASASGRRLADDANPRTAAMERQPGDQ
jgi:hypothetical protein